LARVPAGQLALLAQDGQLAVEQAEVGREVAAVGEPGGDAQRPVA
jgi:hypothetical protein